MSLESALAAIEKKAAQRIAAIALDLHAEARLNATGRNGGPKVVTGTGRAAIQAVQLGPLEWAVGVTGAINPENGQKASIYMAVNEFGSRTRKAYPFMRPAVDAIRAKYRGNL